MKPDQRYAKNREPVYEDREDHIAVPIRKRGGSIIAWALLDRDMTELARFRWTMGTKGYLRRNAGGYFPVIHREVMGLARASEDPRVVDHINGDPLDNRRANLRVTENHRNLQNRRGANPNSKSGIRGVCYSSRLKKWRVTATVKWKQVSGGLYDTPEEAAVAAAALRERLGFLGRSSA